MNSKYDKEKMDDIFRQMLDDEFIASFAVDLPQIKKIQVFVKTTNEFIWGNRFDDDPAWDYLHELGYTKIHICAACEIQGSWVI